MWIGFVGRDWCKIVNSIGAEIYSGTYSQCIDWLKSRNCY